MQNQLSILLKAAQEHLFRGIKLSKQAAYGRRAPELECLPAYGEARRLSLLVLEQDPANREALMIMSQISEGVMDFKNAQKYLNKAFEAGEPRTKKNLKRLALLHENAKEWGDLILAPEDLRDLGKYLTDLGVGMRHQTLEFTRDWLANCTTYDVEQVIKSLERRGAFSDFQVLANVVHG